MSKFKLSFVLVILGLFLFLTVNFHLLILSKILNLSTSQIENFLPAFKVYANLINILSFILVMSAAINALIIYKKIASKKALIQ